MVSAADFVIALSRALEAWNIGPGDAVFVPDFTFFSSGECPADEGAMPIYVDVDSHTYNMDPVKLEEAVKKVFDCTPAGIIKTLSLKQPIYRKTASYGHFGREGFPWENTDKVNELKAALN